MYGVISTTGSMIRWPRNPNNNPACHRALHRILATLYDAGAARSTASVATAIETAADVARRLLQDRQP